MKINLFIENLIKIKELLDSLDIYSDDILITEKMAGYEYHIELQKFDRNLELFFDIENISTIVWSRLCNEFDEGYEDIDFKSKRLNQLFKWLKNAKEK